MSEKKQLVLATHNAGKLAEFRALFEPFGFELLSAKELGLIEPEETGKTFIENATIKARAALEATNLPALSDDSGLEVEALGGAPGVYTADWAMQPDGSRNFALAMQKVEQALQEKGALARAQRRARFVSVICLASTDGSYRYFSGQVEGHLVWPPRGEKGFGFDPAFEPDGYDKTFGEMHSEEKHSWKIGQGSALSHRARAFKKLAEEFLLSPDR